MIRVRRPFILNGRIPPSKSWLNRALILRSLHPQLRIADWEISELDGEDVTRLCQALEDLSNGRTEFDIGESGTGFRFLLARLSRERGIFTIRGRRRLFQRPHAVLYEALATLGTQVTLLGEASIQINSSGWPGENVNVAIDASESSQFASALKLVASTFPHTLNLSITGTPRSLGYLEMTEAMVSAVANGRKVLVPETDASSIAAFACLAVAAWRYSRTGGLHRLATRTLEEEHLALNKTLDELESQVSQTQQPDRRIFEELKKMRLSEDLTSLDADLGGAPDLFPCLAALAVFARGTSRLHGAPHLRLKESDRIAGIARLFRTIGISFRELSDGIEIEGVTVDLEREFSQRRKQGLPFQFDPESDHRLAFAAAVLAAGGIPLEISNRGVVAKSFPLFWSMIEGDSPRIALIGHRGTGKTKVAVNWALQLGPRATMIDLDREIERLSGKSVQDFFETVGESAFRWTEKQAWREVDSETRSSIGTVIVACGAGFDPAIIDDSWTRIWIRRVTDADGRVFLDRPRLERDVDALTESKLRFKRREPCFAATADRVLQLGEGEDDPASGVFLRDVLDDDASVAGIGGAVTLLPHHNVSETIERLVRWGVARIEIRDDLWPAINQAAWQAFQTLPKDRLIVSFRSVSEAAATLQYVRTWLECEDDRTSSDALIVDWSLDRSLEIPSELVSLAMDGKIKLIVSVHGLADETTLATLESFERRFEKISGLVFKVALETPDFAKLKRYHEWMMAAPNRRVFLPMTPLSDLGPQMNLPRWQWYRAWLGTRAALGLNFWREDDGSSLDQPTFSQWWRRRRSASKKFAAVLGDPVLHSRTPLEHDAFFRNRDAAVFEIPVRRDESDIALPFLIDLGLIAAAVTAPLKEKIVHGSAMNTLAIVDGQMQTTNTDDVGFEVLWKETLDLRRRIDPRLAQSGFESGEGVVVWGGGGVRKSLRDVLPGAIFYSASQGKPRDESLERASAAAWLNSLDTSGPQIVVWAAGDTRGAWPPSWKPRLIVDLSYKDDSIARIIALEADARYVSGLAMFSAQAKAQREFWQGRIRPIDGRPDGNRA